MKSQRPTATVLALMAGLFLLAVITGCDNGKELPGAASSSVTPDSLTGVDHTAQDITWDIQSEYDTVYITIADTGSEYHVLDSTMYTLRDRLPAKVDTMGRFYDPAIDSLIVSENDGDEMWAGAYFPRRGEGSELSLEYLSWYTGHSAPNTFALFTGIWPSRSLADSAVSAQREAAPGAFVLQASIYMGCMH